MSPGAWSSPEDAFPAPGLGCLLRYPCFLQRAAVTPAGVPRGQPTYLLCASVSPILPAALPVGAAHVGTVSPITSFSQEQK